MKLNSTTNQAEALPDRQQPLPPFSGPVFVSGVWRSGTSLLYTLLNQHPQIGLLYEGDLPLLRPMFHFRHIRKNWLEKWEYWNAAVSRHGLDSFLAPPSITSLREALEAAGQEYCKKKGATIWGCKSPSYYDRLVQLSHDFSSARFVIIWRDPEDICRSVISAAASSRWFGRVGMVHRAMLACLVLRKQCDELISAGIPVHQLHYEDLVENTTETMRSICEFLNVPFVSGVTSLEGADRAAVFQGAHHSMVRGAQIVSSRKPRGPLPARVESKIRQYKALWKAASVGELCRYSCVASDKKPSKLQRFTDRFLFFLLRLKDGLSPVVYSIVPLGLWRLYRALKYHDPDFIEYHNRAVIDQPRPKTTGQYFTSK